MTTATPRTTTRTTTPRTSTRSGSTTPTYRAGPSTASTPISGPISPSRVAKLADAEHQAGAGDRDGHPHQGATLRAGRRLEPPPDVCEEHHRGRQRERARHVRLTPDQGREAQSGEHDVRRQVGDGPAGGGVRRQGERGGQHPGQQEGGLRHGLVVGRGSHQAERPRAPAWRARALRRGRPGGPAPGPRRCRRTTRAATVSPTAIEGRPSASAFRRCRARGRG